MLSCVLLMNMWTMNWQPLIYLTIVSVSKTNLAELQHYNHPVPYNQWNKVYTNCINATSVYLKYA